VYSEELLSKYKKYKKEEVNYDLPKYLKNKEHPFLIRIGKNENENFCISDSEERFKENLKIMPSDWKYRTKEVKYRYNSSGYRTYEWKDIDWKNAIVVLGCSIVFGVGLAEEETFCYQIEKMTGRQTINLGFPGGSNETIGNNCASLINNFDAPYAVIASWTVPDRFRFYEKNDFIDVGNWYLNNKEIKKTYDTLIQHEDHIMIKNFYIYEYVKAMLTNKTKLINFTFFKKISSMNNITLFNYTGLARDNEHPCSEDNEKVAKYILEKI
jgi:hypothetical protein